MVISAFCLTLITISGFRSLSPTKQYKNSFGVWNFIILLQFGKCVIIEWWLELSCNHTNVPTPNITGVNGSVLCCWVFHYVHFQHFGVLKTRYLHIVYFAQPNNIQNLRSLIICYSDVKWVMRHFRMVNRTIVQSYQRSQTKFWSINSSVLFCWAFHYGHFDHFGELKTRFLDVVHFARPSNLGNSFGVWKLIILLLWVKCIIFEWWFQQSCKHTNVPRPNFKVINSSALFLWAFLDVNFHHFVTWKRDFWTSFIKPNQTIQKTVSGLVIYNRDVMCEMCHFIMVIATIVQSYQRP